ncbi:hypothetical protein QQP08_019876 [Theobroma cacao]|nr:hypothetical protein QQP08_019876 [Theobroma cacao]
MACEKTVYPVELCQQMGFFIISLASNALGNYSSMEGVLYCKPHFEQLFKETGNFNKNFQSPAAESAEKLTPELVNLLCNTKCV